MPKITVKGQTVQTGEHPQTNGQTHGRYQTYYRPCYAVDKKLKLIDHLCTTCWTPPSYWQTDNSNGLVMVICNYHWLNSASWVLISTCSTPLVQTGERKQFSLFDLDLWPTTLTYNPRLANVKVDPRAKNQGQRSNSSNRRAPTDKRSYQTYYRPCYVVDKKKIMVHYYIVFVYNCSKNRKSNSK